MNKNSHPPVPRETYTLSQSVRVKDALGCNRIIPAGILEVVRPKPGAFLVAAVNGQEYEIHVTELERIIGEGQAVLSRES